MGHRGSLDSGRQTSGAVVVVITGHLGSFVPGEQSGNDGVVVVVAGVGHLGFLDPGKQVGTVVASVVVGGIEVAVVGHPVRSDPGTHGGRVVVVLSGISGGHCGLLEPGTQVAGGSVMTGELVVVGHPG